MASKHIQVGFAECVRHLKSHSFEDPELTVMFTFEFVLGDKYIDLLAQDYELTLANQTAIYGILERCLNHEPLAYILGETYFKTGQYKILPGVLIPRPETEELVDHGIVVIQTLLNQGVRPRIFECGVGSGVISIELAKQFPDLNFFAWDISSAAIDLTAENMQRHHVSNIELIHADFFESYQTTLADGHGQVLLVSNPPYISMNDYNELSDVVKNEPIEALVAPDNGLQIISQLLHVAIDNQFSLISEMGYDQKAAIAAQWSDYDIDFKVDLSGKNRFLF